MTDPPPAAGIEVDAGQSGDTYREGGCGTDETATVHVLDPFPGRVERHAGPYPRRPFLRRQRDQVTGSSQNLVGLPDELGCRPADAGLQLAELREVDVHQRCEGTQCVPCGLAQPAKLLAESTPVQGGHL